MTNIEKIDSNLFKLELDINSLILCYDILDVKQFESEYNYLIDKINYLKLNKKRLLKLNSILYV